MIQEILFNLYGMSLCIKPLIVAGQDMAFMSGKDRVWQKEVHLMSNYLCGQRSALSLMLKSQNPSLLLIKINDGEGKRFSYLNDKNGEFCIKDGHLKNEKIETLYTHKLNGDSRTTACW